MLKNPRELHAYQSGFLGRTDGAAVLHVPVATIKTVNNMMYQVSNDTPKASLLISGEIDRLADELLHVHLGALKFDNRHAFLEEVVSLLPSANFAQFCLVQLDSPYFGSLQRDFLEDTIRFVKTGQRRMNIHNWASLFHHHTTNATAKRVKYDPKVVDSLKYEYSSYSFSYFYGEWLGKPNGLIDMTKTFKLIFGTP